MAGYKDPPREHCFKPGQSGNPTGKNAGRPPKAKALRMLNELLGEEEEPVISEPVFDEVFLRMLDLNMAQLTKIVTNPEAPIYMVYIASMIKDNTKRGRTDLYRDIKNLIFKKADEGVSGTIIFESGIDLGDKYGRDESEQTAEGDHGAGIDEAD